MKHHHLIGILFVLEVGLVSVDVSTVEKMLRTKSLDTRNKPKFFNTNWLSNAELSLQRFFKFRNDTKVCSSSVTSCKGACGQYRAIPCSCDFACQLYENCCEDFLDFCQSITLDQIKENYLPIVNISVNIGCHPYVPFLLISGCPADVDTKASRRCLKNDPNTMADVVPVSIFEFNLHFKNRFCAECNGVYSTEYWSGSVVGEAGFGGLHNFMRGLSRDELIIEWKTPPLTNMRPCFPAVQEERSEASAANSSNVSSILCNAFTSYVRSTETGKRYRNRFCFEGLDDSNSSNVSCEPETDIPASGSDNVSFTFRKGPGDNEWLISEMSNPPRHVSVLTCYDNGTTSCKITHCVESYTLQEGSCQRRRVKLNIKSTINPTDSGMEDPPYESMETFVSRLSRFLIRHMGHLGAEGSRCVLDSETKSLIYDDDDDVIWKLDQTFLCKSRSGDDVLDKLTFFQTDLSLKMTRALKLAFSQLTVKVDAKFAVCLMDEDSVSTVYDVCFQTASKGTAPARVLRASEYVESIVSNVVCTISVVSLFIRLILQAFIPFYQTDPGKVQFCLCLTLFIAYVVFLLGEIVPKRSTICVVLSVVTHWGFLSALLWMNMIAFKMWQTFRSWKCQVNPKTTFTLCRSAVFAVVPPLLTVITALLLDNFIPDSDYSPNYGNDVCWITKSASMIVFFVIPSNFITIVNSVFVYLALLGIWKERKAFRVVATVNRKMDLELAAKVIVLVGATWLVGLFAIVLKYDFAWMLFTIINGSLGFLISFALLCNRRMYHIAKKPIARCIQRLTHREVVEPSVASVSTSAYKLSAQSYKVSIDTS